MMRKLMYRLREAGLLLALCAALGMAGCFIDSKDESGAADQPDIIRYGDTRARPRTPQKVDILWVIQPSAGMCQENVALSRAFDEFALKLQTQGLFDIRTAVATTDAIKRAGRFANDPASDFPPACFESKVHPCLGDEDCTKEFGNGWECKGYPANQIYNKNRSINSGCTFRCNDDAECCGEFCFADECGADQSCLAGKCQSAPDEDCTFECKQPGRGVDGSGCLHPPDTADCPASLPTVLTNDNLELFKCLIAVAPEQSYQANLTQGLRAAWQALNPDGANAEQAAGFLRTDALLLVIFVSHDDDCSIDTDYASPNYQCDDDDNCSGGECKTDVHFSKKTGKQIKLCHGLVKKDYFNVCSLLGEHKGTAHHNCAYDLDCRDCESDSDCDYGWYCKQDKKCRPEIYSLVNIASFQSPPGTPINSLSPVAEFHHDLKSLKPDPAMVLVAAIVGDGMPQPPGKNPNADEPSLISDDCLEDEKLKLCTEYAALAEDAGQECVKDPGESECMEFYNAKLECIRECYISSKGDPASPTVAKNSYVCESDMGKADYGSRYVRLTQMFGPNGIKANICAAGGMGAALDRIADRLLESTVR